MSPLPPPGLRGPKAWLVVALAWLPWAVAFATLWVISENTVPAYMVEPAPVGEMPTLGSTWVGSERAHALKERRERIGVATRVALFRECLREGNDAENACAAQYSP